MKKNIVCILVITLLFSFIVPNIVGYELRIQGIEKVDQSQELQDNSYGIGEDGLYQYFKPNVDKLTKADIFIEKPGLGTGTTYKYYTLGIKKGTHDSQSLVSKTLDTSDLTDSTLPKWYEFDFPDLEVEKGSTYILHLYASEFQYPGFPVNWGYYSDDVYGQGSAWYGSNGDKYPIKNNAGEYCDFTFRTHGETKLSKDISINTPFLTFLENHPHLFPLIRQILRLN